MSERFPMGSHRRAESQQVARIQSLRQLHDRIVVAVERSLQRVFNRDGVLIPIPVKAVADR